MEVNIDDKLLDSVMSQARINERLRMNYNIHETLEAPVQRLLNALVKNTKIQIHRHGNTDETYILLKGRVVVQFYDIYGSIIKQFELDPLKGHYGINVPKGQWHTLDVVEDSVVFEIKEGPYKPFQPEDLLENNIQQAQNRI